MSDTTISTTDHATGRQKLYGHLAMVCFASLIAGSFSLGALAVPHIGAAPLNAFRYFSAAVLMGVFAFGLQRHRLQFPRAPWRYLILGALFAVYFVTMFVALGISNPVSVGAVFTLTPLLAAVFGRILLGQHVRPVVLASILIAGAGSLWVIFRGDIDAMLALRIGRGEAIFLVGVVCHALYTPLVRKFLRGEPGLVSTFWVLAATAFWLTVYGFKGILETDWAGLPAIVWVAIGYLTIFTSAITVFLIQFASMRLPAGKVMAYGYLTPAIIIMLEGLLGHGWATGAVLAGAGVIVFGLIVLAFAPDG
jgi:drug/metabolite transporter (DMT)-like permease